MNSNIQNGNVIETSNSELEQDKITPLSTNINILTRIKQVSSTKSEDEKILQLKQIRDHVENLDIDKLIIEISNEICAELKDFIQVEKTEVQLEVLNIILIITEKGSEMVQQREYNKFQQTFKESGLLRKIKQIFIQQIEIQKEMNSSNQYSELFSKLVLIISYINKSMFVDDDILEACGNYIKFQINYLFEILRNLMNQKDIEEQYEEQRKQLIEAELKEEEEMISAISRIAEDLVNQRYLVVQLKIHEDISPFLHIRCPEELNCSQCLNLPESEYTNQFLSSIYKLLAEFSYNQKTVTQFLMYNNQIFKHFSPLIISFSTNNSHKLSETNPIQHTTISINPITTLSLIVEYLNLLSSLLTENTSLCQTSYNTPDLIKALNNLSRFGKKQHQSEKIEKYYTQIKLRSNHCLDEINYFGDEILKERILYENTYIRIQTEVIGTGGGSEEQNDQVIERGLVNIQNIFYINREINDEKYHGKIQLLKTINEQIIEQGGLEEIESNIFNMNLWNKDRIYQVYRAKGYIINSKKDRSNQ